MTPKQEARLYGRAIKSRWDVPQETKQIVIETLTEIATDQSLKESARVSACNAIIAAESQNQKDEHKVVDIGIAKRNAELDAIASDLGIDPRLILDAERASGDSDC
jgi:hypothetical protein